jgi:purine-binding chemotaxis protein CheW
MSQETQAGATAPDVRPVGQMLTFAIAGETYGIDILAVQEIKAYIPSTPLPNAPPTMCGVINLRGVIIPILNLRRMLGLPEAIFGKYNVIIVVRLRGKVSGLVVDSVADVIDIAASDVHAPPGPAGGGSSSASHVRGLVRVGERMVILLEVERLAPGGADA